MRILITGVSGMLGATLFKILNSGENEVYGTGNSNFDEQPENYKSFDLIAESYDDIINWSKPDLIILSGALTNGNYCNINPDKALSINGLSVKKFLNATKDTVKIIYISTDAVFPSSLHMAKETDCVSPENVYGKSKELGEFFTKLSDREYCIIRTTIVGLNINSNKQGFVEWIIKSSNMLESISLFDDVIFNPISIWDLGKEINHIISLNKFPNEILHVSGTDNLTKYAFGTKLLNELNLDSGTIKKGSITSFKDRAKRCSDQTLDCSYYQKKFNRELPSIFKTIKTIKHHYHESD